MESDERPSEATEQERRTGNKGLKSKLRLIWQFMRKARNASLEGSLGRTLTVTRAPRAEMVVLSRVELPDGRSFKDPRQNFGIIVPDIEPLGEDALERDSGKTFWPLCVPWTPRKTWLEI
jgi:hypothetical protein